MNSTRPNEGLSPTQNDATFATESFSRLSEPTGMSDLAATGLTQQLSEIERKPRKWALFGALCLVAAGLGGGYYWSRLDPQLPPVEPATQATAEPAPEPLAQAPKAPAAPAPALEVRTHFAYDSARLEKSGKALLDQWADRMKREKLTTLVIEGHADERGTARHNMALGARRAAAARAYLVGRGVEAHRLQTVSYGKMRPLVRGNNEAAWAHNRRIELKAKATAVASER
jgi:peptidoglycan-associated lipoprotein